MTDEIRRRNDRAVQELLSRAHALLSAGKTKQGLRLVNRIDLQYPNRREVLDFRNECLRKAGVRQFAEWSEDDERVSVDFDANAIGWTDSPLGVDPVPPGRPVLVPTLQAFDPSAYRDPRPAEAAPAPTHSLPMVAIATAVLVIYGAVLLRELMPEQRGGDVREFAGIQFVWVPNDSTIDADPKGSGGSAGFWIGRYEVTQEQWFQIRNSNPSAQRGNRLPVDSVSPGDVQGFLATLNRQGAGQVRLPTASLFGFGALDYHLLHPLPSGVGLVRGALSPAD